MFARCYETAGLSREDRVQICVGYGVWTAGVGFQLGCERFGALAIPAGPGNIDLQIQFLVDFQTTVLCCTASMALLLAEEIDKRGIRDQIRVKKVIFGAERSSDAMRSKVKTLTGADHIFDIPGLTEVYGPGHRSRLHLPHGHPLLGGLLHPGDPRPGYPGTGRRGRGGRDGLHDAPEGGRAADPLPLPRPDAGDPRPVPLRLASSPPRPDRRPLRRHVHRPRGEHLSQPHRRDPLPREGGRERIPDPPRPPRGRQGLHGDQGGAGGWGNARRPTPHSPPGSNVRSGRRRSSAARWRSSITRAFPGRNARRSVSSTTGRKTPAIDRFPSPRRCLLVRRQTRKTHLKKSLPVAAFGGEGFCLHP